MDACASCGLLAVSYNSCRNRACPKCQWAAQARWVRQREGELLNTQYFHLVFTVPHDLNALFLSNDVRLYNLLFRCAWETLDQLARQPQWLGAQPGMLAVLHTWGQKLDFHPHVHCIVPGGGMAPDGGWVGAKKGFFVPVGVLSALFRGKFLTAIKQMYGQGSLSFFGCAAALEGKHEFGALVDKLYRSKWVVYAKAPLCGPEQVIRYLGRYTHRIAISNRRILHVADGKVTFAYKDRRDNDRDKTMTLDTSAFIRRFLLHILPQGFHKIRHFGLLAIRNRKTKLASAQRQLGPTPQPHEPVPGLIVMDAPILARPPCPACGANNWRCLERLPEKVFKPTLKNFEARPPPTHDLPDPRPQKAA